MKQVALATAVVLATLLGAAALWEFRGAGVLFVLSLAIAAAVRPGVVRLSAAGLPRRIALVACYFVIVVAAGGLVYFAGGQLLQDMQRAMGDLVARYEPTLIRWKEGNDLQRLLAQRLPEGQQLFPSLDEETGTTAAQTALGVTFNVFGVLMDLIIVFALSIYWALDQAYFERLWLSLVPADRRADARGLWRDVEMSLGAYLRSELAQSLLAWLLFGLGFWWLGIPYPTLLAFLAAAAWLIPWAGAVLAFIPVVTVALLTTDLSHVAMVAGYTALVLVGLELMVEPRLFDRRQASSLLIVFVVVAMTDLYGVWGLLVGPPLAAAIHIAAAHVFRQLVSARTAAPIGDLGDIERRCTALEEAAAGAGESIGAEISSLLARLSTLVKKATANLPAQTHALGTGEPVVRPGVAPREPQADRS